MLITRNNKEIEITTILENKEKATIFHHFKDKDYQIIGIGNDAEDLKKVVVYQAIYEDKKIWVREYNDFFSEVDKNKYPDIKQKYRFEIKE